LDVAHEYALQVKDCLRDLDSLNNLYVDIITVLHGDTNRAPAENERPRLISKLLVFWKGEGSFVTRVGIMAHAIRVDTDRGKEEAEARLRFWKNMSVVLFIVGWFISFIAIVCGSTAKMGAG
jgi:hypothetical protein